MIYDYIVIGAGVSGLASAIILAKSGYSVAVVEKSGQICPLLRGFIRKGVHFDTGFHYTGGLGKGESLELIFRYLGLADELNYFPFQEERFDVLRSIRDGFEFQFPTGYEAIRDKLCTAFPAEQAAIERYLQLVKNVCASMPYLNLAVDIGSDNPLQRLDDTSLQETLDALTGNQLLKALLSMHCVLYGVSPSEVPFTQHACIIGNYYLSASGIRGGGLSLARAFDNRLRQLGIDVYCGSEVTAINASAQDGVTGVRLQDGRELGSTGCIATLHPAAMLELVPAEFFRPAYRNRLKGLEETISAHMIFAVATEPLPVLAGSNLFVFPDIDCIKKLGSKSLEESMMYLTAAYRGIETEPKGLIGISPAGYEQTAAWQQSLTGRRCEAYRQFKEKMISCFTHHIERSCPELRGKMQYVEGSTPLTVRDFNNTPKGGLYGIKHMVGQYNPLPVTKLKGLLLAGQAVVSPGVMGAVLSAFITCGNILGHDRLRKELKACS